MRLARRFGWEIALAVALGAGLSIGATLLVRTWPLERLPLWDSAGNGWAAVELWSALSAGRLFDFLARLNAQDVWPFGFSLLLLPVAALEGGSFQALTLVPAIAFALVPAALVALGGEIERGPRGAFAGLLAGGLWLTSPLARGLATVVMRETTGALLGVVVLLLVLRARRLGTMVAWRAAGVALVALAAIKANYALMMGAALAAHAALELPAARRLELRLAARRELARGWRSAWWWSGIVAALAALALLAGLNPGNFVYGAVVAATVARLARPRPPRPVGGAGPAARALFETVVVPLWIWALSPSPIHPHSLFAFLRNRPGAEPVFSAGALGFYPRAFVEELAATPVLAGAVALLLAAGIGVAARRRDPARAVAIAAAIAVAALVLHPLKEARFLVTAAPFLFLVAALAAVRLVAPPGAGTRVRPRVAASLALAGWALWAAGGAAAARLERDHDRATAPPAMLGALNAAVFAVGACAPPVAFVGGLNELSESLVRWEAWRSGGREADLVRPLRGLDGRTPPAEVRARLGDWLRARRPACVVALEPAPGSPWLEEPDYRRWNGWQPAAIAELERRSDWVATRRRDLVAARLELTVYEPR